MKEVEVLGYKVRSDGTIIGVKMNRAIAKNSRQIGIKISNKRKTIEKTKFIYWAFHQDFDINNNNYMVIEDTNIVGEYVDRLKLVNRHDVNRQVNYKLSEEDRENIRRLYFSKENILVNNSRRYSLGKLAKMYHVSRTSIVNIIKKGGEQNEHREITE